ncbi:unnamed protein product [Enterobius vermicularis]|uniref:Pyridoxamine 5'-phosphate oxidase n=1 Tax=Enterobius vermicularis TaxID=51028 RepID=A0A0N4VNU8_ENTVE|nr:unnamed protein product [Enterobius vermicularis]
MLGVVVSTTLPRPDTPLVVIIFVDKDLPLYYTKNVNRSVQTRMSKEERKRMDKLVKQKGLEFGDWISFQEKDVRGRVIDEYEKIRPAMECRINGEHMQVSLYRDTSV